VSSIFAQIVCENDFFEYDTGEVKHRIDFKKARGTMYAVYCVIKFKDGGMHTEVMTKEDVDRIRSRSKAKSNGPWVSDYDEMAKKTVFRRGSKWVVLSPEIQDALDKEDDGKLPSLVAEVSSEMLSLPGESPEPDDGEKVIELKPEETTKEKQPEKQPEETPKEAATAGGEKLHTVQDSLAEVVLGAGYKWENFAQWAHESGNLPDASSLPGFAEVPTDTCKRLLRAKVGLLKSLEQTKGAA